jgi:aerobic carbon-monoxide dehydrogenase small subunit
MIPVEITINDQYFSLEVEPEMTLLELLREIGVKSVKKGCGEGDCGACGIIMDGVYLKSCLLLALQADGRDIRTVEAMGTVEEPHVLQTSFVDAGAVQCGYCIPSMLLAAEQLLVENPKPNDDEIKEALDGNLCRCTGYVKQIDAVRNAAKIMEEGDNE